MNSLNKNWFKWVLGLLVCFLIRILPFRPPNIEPILTTQMPFAKAYGPFAGFAFAALSVLLYDTFTNSVGIWTLFTALIYGVLGVWASYYFKNRQNKPLEYVKFAVMGTIVYDSITLFLGPIFFHQPLTSALVGQIPFTALHLIGNVSFSIFLSPIIYEYIIKGRKFAFSGFITRFKLHKI